MPARPPSEDSGSLALSGRNRIREDSKRRKLLPGTHPLGPGPRVQESAIEDLVKERFGTDAARELSRIPGLFESGKLYPRSHITETLRDEFVRRGGDDHTRKDAVARVLKKWLAAPSSPFRKEIRGRYRFRGFDETTGQTLGMAEPVRATEMLPELGRPAL